MKNNIVWLASYPKSGNTWFRTFLSTILNEKKSEPDINDLQSTPIASARGIFEDHVECESSDLSSDEVESLRPDVYREISDNLEDKFYMKVHDAYTKTKESEWLFPPEATFGVIYLVRNPLDVAVSFANHNSGSIDKTVDNLCNNDFALCKHKKSFSNQLLQRHLTWSGHVLSWIDSPNKVCVLRYEDMKLDSLRTFKKACDFLNLDKSDKEIAQAIEKTSFDKLRKQEEEKSFNEKPQKCKFFFRKGKIGSWREKLKNHHVDKLISCHYDVMKRFGYLDKNDKLVF
ncbi:MAG: sulfotransferase domain-containing protein [Pseudomonadota bacterium]